MIDRDEFFKMYANLPPSERRNVIVIVDGEPYSWNVVFVELVNKTKLSKKMLDKLNKALW